MTTPHPPPYVHRAPQLPTHPHATTALVLGIIGVVGLFIVAPLAWYFGAVAQREAERQPLHYRSAGQARAGIVLGIIGTALLGLGLLLMFMICAFIVIGARYDAGYGT